MKLRPSKSSKATTLSRIQFVVNTDEPVKESKPGETLGIAVAVWEGGLAGIGAAVAGAGPEIVGKRGVAVYGAMVAKPEFIWAVIFMLSKPADLFLLALVV